MPTIDQRDITLTENGRPVVRHAVAGLATYSTLATGYSLATRASLVTGNNPDGEISRHELRIMRSGVVKATFFWDAVSEWSGAPPATWSITEDEHASTPAHSGPVTGTRPPTATSWSADFTIDSGWYFDAYVWPTTTTGFTPTISATAITGGIEFTLTLREGSQTRFAGKLKFTHDSTQVTMRRGELRVDGKTGEPQAKRKRHK